MNDFLSDLCEWLKADPWGRKVLFTRSRVAGNQLLRMAAAHGAPAVNAVPMTVREYMYALADPVLAKNGLRRIDSLTAAIALQEIMRQSGDAFTTMGAVELSTAASVLPQLEELERSGITPDQLAGTGESLLSSVWRRLQAWKRENRYADEKQVLDAAVPPAGVSFAILSSTEIDRTENAFLAKIPVDKLEVIRLKVPEGRDYPRNAYIESLPFFSGRQEDIYADVACFSCQDIGAEIRFAFQYLIENGIPAEQAVIVCPDDAYGLRVPQEGRLLGLGVDSLFGTPASATKTALMIRCLLDWADRNYDAESLTPALVSGSMGVYNSREELEVTGRTLLRLLRKERVGWGKERWALFSGSGDAAQAAAGRLMNGWIAFFEAPARPVRQAAAELTELLRRSMMHGDDNRFYLTFADELSRIYTGDMTGREYLAHVQEVAAEQRISTAIADQPGNVYCCSYENALFVDRPTFLLLGMSWDAFDSLGSEFPLLHDDRKAALSEHLSLAEDRAAGKRFAVKEFLLNRRDAHVVFCRPRMDYTGGTDLLPASLFTDAARKYVTENPDAGRKTDAVPGVSILGRSPLTRLDAYLQNGYAPGAAASGADPGREALWRQAFESRRFSATSLETASHCPRWYALSVQMGIDQERPEALEQFGPAWLSAADRGSLVHDVLERYFAEISPRTDTPDQALLDRLLDAGIAEYKRRIPVPSNLTDLSAEIDAVRRVVTEAARMHAEDPARCTVGTEVPFGEDPPVSLTFGAYTIRLKGRIDRVDRVGDAYEIIDYKTGRPSGFRRDLDNKLQYYLYTLAWEQLHPDRPVSRASYYLLDGAGGIGVITLEMDSGARAELYRKMTDLLALIADPEKAFTPQFDLDEAKREAGYGSCPGYCPFVPLCREVFG